jgi:hypothetical protein
MSNPLEKVIEAIAQEAAKSERASMPELEALARRGRETLSAMNVVIDRARRLVEVANAADLPRVGVILAAFGAVHSKLLDAILDWERRRDALAAALLAGPSPGDGAAS